MNDELLVEEIIRLTEQGRINWEEEICEVKAEIARDGLGYEAKYKDLRLMVFPRTFFKSKLFVGNIRILTKRKTINRLLRAIYKEIGDTQRRKKKEEKERILKSFRN